MKDGGVRQGCLVNHLQFPSSALHFNVRSCQSCVFTQTQGRLARQPLNFSRDCVCLCNHFPNVCEPTISKDESDLFGSFMVAQSLLQFLRIFQLKQEFLYLFIYFHLNSCFCLQAAEHADQRRLQARTSPEGAAGAGGSELGMPRGDPQSQVRKAKKKKSSGGGTFARIG